MANTPLVALRIPDDLAVRVETLRAVMLPDARRKDGKVSKTLVILAALRRGLDVLECESGQRPHKKPRKRSLPLR